jgi:O-antigen/teichoic acid export membrane protein
MRWFLIRHLSKIQRSGNSVLGLLNVGLRGVTLLSKFILLFFLAKYLEPDKVGLYGLVTATISYAFYFLGFEFYTFSNREIVKSHLENWAPILKSQAYFTAIMYLLLTPFLILIFTFKLLPFEIIGYFFVLLVLEHLSQEFNRIFVAMTKPLLASLILFVRSGLWVYFLVATMYFTTDLHNLKYVFQFWIAGALIACLVSALYIYKLKLPGWNLTVDKSWIKRGCIRAAPFFLASAAIRGIFTIDRYWFEALTDLKTVGAYVLFMSLSNAIISFLDSGVFVFAYPQLIKAHENKSTLEFNLKMKKLLKLVTGLLVISSPLIYFGTQPLLQILGKSHYIEFQWMLPALLLATSIFCLGLIPQYGLYAQEKDRHIIISNLISFFVFIATAAILSQFVKEWAILIALNISLFCGSLWCTLMYLKHTPKYPSN